MNPQKLDVGSVFDRVFALYREQISLLIPAALVIFVPIAILNGLVLSAGSLLGSLLAAAISVVATYWYQGMIVQAAEDMLDGRRDHTVGSLIQSATPFIVPLLVVGILAGIVILIGLVLLIVPGLYLLTIWAVLAPVIVIERSGAIDAFGRSYALVRGNGWPVFGVIVLLFILQLVVGLVVNGILNGSFALLALGDLIVKLLIVPLSGLAAAVLYFGLKAAHAGEGTAAAAAVGGGPESPVPGGAAPPPQEPLPSSPGVPPQAPPPGELPTQEPPQGAGGPQAPAG